MRSDARPRRVVSVVEVTEMRFLPLCSVTVALCRSTGKHHGCGTQTQWQAAHFLFRRDMPTSAAEWLAALKSALPYVGRTDVKIVLALIGAPKPVSYDKLTVLTGHKPFQCLIVMERSGFLTKTGEKEKEAFTLNEPSMWKPKELKRIRKEFHETEDRLHMEKMETAKQNVVKEKNELYKVRAVPGRERLMYELPIEVRREKSR